MAELLYIQQGTPNWLSPSIWLTVGSSTPTWTAVGGPSTNGMTGNVENVINVQVNRMGGGSDPSTVEADVYVCVPTPAGIGPGGTTLVSAGGTQGLKATAAGPVQTFPQVLQMPWYPTNVEASLNGGHICIGANAYDYAGDGGPLGPAGVINLADQHMAQRNIAIVPAPIQHQPQWLSVNFFIPPAGVFPPGTGNTALIKVQPVPVERTLSAVVREQLLLSSRVALTGGNAAAQTAPGGLPEPRERTLLRGGGELVLTNTEIKIITSQSPPPQIMLQGPCGFAAEQQITLQANPMTVTALFEVTLDQAGEVFEFDIVHQLPTGQVIGGLRAVVITMANGQ